jgi:hypothetical protein
MSSNKVVKVSYTINDVFCIPKNINLEDETQVECWEVKYNRLYIYLTNGKELKISSKGWIEDPGYKYPDKSEIVDAEEVCIDDEDKDFKEVEVEVEVEEDEEDEVENNDLFDTLVAEANEYNKIK